MQALVVPDAKDNILSLSKIADQGYRFCGDKYSMEFCNPCSGHVFTAYGNVKQCYVIDLATTNHKKPSNCNFMQRVPLGLLSTLFSREQIQRARGVRKLHVVLGHPSDYTLICMLDHQCIINYIYVSHDVRKTLL